MMNKIQHRFFGCLVFMMIVGLLSGCASKEISNNVAKNSVPPCDAAIVYSDRANSEGSLESAVDYIQSVIEHEGALVLVESDGNPDYIEGRYELDSSNDRRKKAEVNEKLQKIEQIDFVATDPEVDLLAAFRLADARMKKNSTAGTVNYLIIIDSGISTSGPIDFTQSDTRNALLAPETFMNQLRERGDFINLDNIDEVVWYGLGETRNSQGKLNNGTTLALEDFYTCFFREAGVKGEITFESGEKNNSSAQHEPVTAVDLPRIAVDKDGKPIKLGDTLELFEGSGGDGTLTFKFGSSDIEDEDAARAQLQQYIDQLIDFPDSRVVITGYTDTNGSTDANQILSEERANAAKTLFVQAGVLPEQIVAVGKGESTAYPDDAQNRRIEVSFQNDHQ